MTSGADPLPGAPVVDIRALRLGNALDCSQLGDPETLMRLLDEYEAPPPKAPRARRASGSGR